MPETLRGQSLPDGVYQIERLSLDDDGRKRWEPVGEPVDGATMRHLRPHLEQVIEPPRS